MWRLITWLLGFGKNSRLSEPLHTPPPDDREAQRKLREIDLKQRQLDRELAIIVANMHHTDERFDQR